jgi:hypothetical protein
MKSQKYNARLDEDTIDGPERQQLFAYNQPGQMSTFYQVTDFHLSPPVCKLEYEGASDFFVGGVPTLKPIW